MIVGGDVLCQEQDCKQLCKRIVYTFHVLDFMLLESERSVAERGFQKRRGSVEARNAAVDELLGSQIKLRDLVIAVAERCKIRTFRAQFQFCAYHRFT